MLIFCYPYGGYNAHTLDILKENDFKAALTVKVGRVSNRTENLLELPRIDTNDLPQ